LKSRNCSAPGNGGNPEQMRLAATCGTTKQNFAGPTPERLTLFQMQVKKEIVQAGKIQCLGLINFCICVDMEIDKDKRPEFKEYFPFLFVSYFVFDSGNPEISTDNRGDAHFAARGPFSSRSSIDRSAANRPTNHLRASIRSLALAS